MPNHISNTLTITGNTKKLNEFQKAIKDKKEVFSIEKMLPMPKELNGISSPPNIIKNPKKYQIELKKWQQEQKKKKPSIFISKPITPKESQELIKKFKANNWYEWAILNYSTKWGSYNSKLNYETLTAFYGSLKYEFDTAWSPPKNAIQQISKMYPSLEFQLEYQEDGMGFKGKNTFINGTNEENEFEEGWETQNLNNLESAKLKIKKLQK